MICFSCALFRCFFQYTLTSEFYEAVAESRNPVQQRGMTWKLVLFLPFLPLPTHHSRAMFFLLQIWYKLHAFLKMMKLGIVPETWFQKTKIEAPLICPVCLKIVCHTLLHAKWGDINQHNHNQAPLRIISLDSLIFRKNTSPMKLKGLCFPASPVRQSFHGDSGSKECSAWKGQVRNLRSHGFWGHGYPRWLHIKLRFRRPALLRHC